LEGCWKLVVESRETLPNPEQDRNERAVRLARQSVRNK
jgi:hypothetical protein